MSYYAISLDISQIMDLDLLVDDFITYTLLDDFTFPNTFVLAEQLAKYTYFTFGEFYATSNERVIAFIELKDKTPEQIGYKNYIELPRKISHIKIDPRIDTILLDFDDTTPL